jgi:tetratricopeptide (TPR) repeat protein
MTKHTQIPNLAELRDFLLRKFTAETFRHLFLYIADPDLRSIRQEFAPADGLTALVAKALEYAQEHDLLDALRREAERYEPSLHAPATTPVLTTPFNLPADLADFTGRQSEVDQVREALSREGAVAISGIHGMGGIGKTTLAVHVAHQLAAEGRFRHAQLYLDLKGTDPTPLDPAAALQSLLSPLLGPDPQRPDDVDALAELWRRAIHGKHAVLILDNAAGAAQVRPLLPGCATCAVLVTSRQRFTLPGAGLLDLDPMDPDEARALLQRLAPRLDDAGADTIAGLCGRLPLALRVAGNYLHLNDDVSPDRYATLLADEKQRLARLRDPDDRDLDVEAAIALSVAQLDDEARHAWALLALFPAPFDLAAAAALWEHSEESAALDQLQALRNRSLVSYDAGTGRYEQHDLLRLAAARELADSAEGEIPAARDRLARHYLAVAREVRDTQHYLDLDPDWPHLRAALEHAAASSDVDLLSDLAYALADYFDARGLARDKITWCQRAADACAAAGRRWDEGGHRGNLGLAYAALGDARQAITQYEQALAIGRKTGDRRMRAHSLGNLGLAYAALGDARQAIEYHQAALPILRKIGERRAEGQVLGNLGTAHARLGETRTAIEQYEQALAIAREIGDRRNEGNWLGNLGAAYAALGEVGQAIAQHEQALAIAREIGDRRGEGNHLGNLGIAYADLGELLPEGDRPGAIGYYEQALAIAREIGDRWGEGAHLANLGNAYKILGDPARARECWTQALAIFEAIEDPNAEKVRGWLAELDQ